MGKTAGTHGSNTSQRIQAGPTFQRAGKALSHTAQAELPSRTMFSCPQAGQLRKTNLCVKSPGCARPIRPSAEATIGHGSGSGQ